MTPDARNRPQVRAPIGLRRSETGAWLVPRLGWPALRTNGVLQPQLARRPLNPLVFAERSAPLDAHPHAPEFLRAQQRIHAIGPIHGMFHRPRLYDGLDRIFSMHPRPQAAPALVLRPRDQPGPHSIPLDVPQDGQQMFVALHREALEPSLTQMTVPDGP